MDVERPKAPAIEEGLRKDCSVRCDYQGVGAHGRNAFDGILRFQRRRLEDLQAMVEREALYRASLETKSAADWLVGLRDDQR